MSFLISFLVLACGVASLIVSVDNCLILRWFGLGLLTILYITFSFKILQLICTFHLVLTLLCYYFMLTYSSSLTLLRLFLYSLLLLLLLLSSTLKSYGTLLVFIFGELAVLDGVLTGCELLFLTHLWILYGQRYYYSWFVYTLTGISYLTTLNYLMFWTSCILSCCGLRLLGLLCFCLYWQSYFELDFYGSGLTSVDLLILSSSACLFVLYYWLRSPTKGVWDVRGRLIAISQYF